MKWIIRAYSIVLLGYTAWRTVDFLLSQLPKNDVSLWLSLAFLFATEAGLLLWHEISLNHATTREQQYLATGLTWLDFVGSLAAGVADMILRQTLLADYKIPPALAQFLIYGLPLIMAANVAGVLVYLSNDAEVQTDRAKKQLKFEITRQALRELRDNSSNIAESMKKSIYAELRNDVTNKVEKQYLKDQKAAQAQPSPNGHRPNIVTYNQDSDQVELADPKNPGKGAK
jgi:hypothetical protein